MTVRQLPDGAEQHVTAGPYSPVLWVKDSKLVCISGQASIDMDGNVVGETIEEQTKGTLENCIKQLETAGCTLDNVIEVTVYLSDLSMWGRFNEVYKTYFKPPYPTRTAIGVNLLPGLQVEITMRAYRN